VRETEDQMFGLDQPTHWLVVIIVAAALFGYKKLPDVSRSVARSLRIFKTEMKGMSADDAARKANETPSDSPYGPNPFAAAPSEVTPPPVAPPAVTSETSAPVAPKTAPPSVG
jgi:sec-independent protein translocase protein TatA